MEKLKKTISFIVLVVLGVAAFSVYQLWLNQNRAQRSEQAVQEKIQRIERGADVIAAAKEQIRALKFPLALGEKLQLDSVSLEEQDNALVFRGSSSGLARSTLTDEQRQSLLSAATQGVCNDPFSQAFLAKPQRKIVKTFSDRNGEPLFSISIDQAWCQKNTETNDQK